jgi:hypothetical protein
VKYLKLAADQGLAVSQLYYALCLTEGIGISRDLMTATRYFRLASGLPGEVDNTGPGPMSPDIAQALCRHETLNRAFGVMNRVGGWLELGHFCQKDVRVAAQCYCESAKGECSAGQANCGFCYEHGLGVEKNMPTSLAYYASSAHRSNPVGAGRYALSLHFGSGCCEDLEAGADHYDFVMQKDPAFLRADSARCFRGLNERPVRKPKTEQTRPGRPSGRATEFPRVGLVGMYEIPPVRSVGLELLGRGRSGVVTLHENPKKRGTHLAVKRLVRGTSWSVFMREVRALVKLRHPCVIPIFGWFQEATDSFGIVMEFALNRTLSAHLGPYKPGPLRDRTRQGRLICEIVLGMRFIHRQGFMHRDLKPLNILVDEDWRGLISDFGLSREVAATGSPSPNTGTDDYSAPEQKIWGFSYTKEVDVYAFGLVAYEIVTGEFATNRRQSALPVGVFGPLLQGLITRCWCEDPADRPSFEAILEEMRANDFAIVPKADPNVIRQSVAKVMAQEHGMSRERR